MKANWKKYFFTYLNKILNQSAKLLKDFYRAAYLKTFIVSQLQKTKWIILVYKKILAVYITKSFDNF